MLSAYSEEKKNKDSLSIAKINEKGKSSARLENYFVKVLYLYLQYDSVVNVDST